MNISRFLFALVVLINVLFVQHAVVLADWPSVLPNSAVLIPNVGQYLAGVQILTMTLVIATQLLRLLGLDYVGKYNSMCVYLNEYNRVNNSSCIVRRPFFLNRQRHQIDGMDVCTLQEQRCREATS